MTIGAVPVSMSDIWEEMGVAGGISLTDTDARWLADNPSGSISLSEFVNKQSVKNVDVAAIVPTAAYPTISFAGINFGTAFTGRLIIVFTFLDATNNSVMDVTGVTIGGVAAVGSDAGVTNASGSLGVGIWVASVPTGTSGTVAITYSDGGFGPTFRASAAQIYVCSTVGFSTTATAQDTAFTTGFASQNLAANCPANGIVFVAAGSNGPAEDLALSGVTTKYEAVFNSSKIIIGWSNRLAANAAFPVTFSGSVAGNSKASIMRTYAQ